MEQVLEEGKQFDEEMTKLAEEEINPSILSGDEDEEEEDSGSASRSSSRGNNGKRSRR
jgi:hypothetical protein